LGNEQSFVDPAGGLLTVEENCTCIATTELISSGNGLIWTDDDPMICTE
jgi:hypothetical protein